MLLRGVDRAAFAVALVARLRAGGVAVSADGPAVLLQAMRRLPPTDRDRLYWAARLSLVNRAEDLGAFDAVFAAVFDGATLGVDPPSLHRSPAGAPVAPAPAGTAGSSTVDAEGLPWATRPATVTASADTGADTPTRLPDLLPSHITARADEPFERFDPDDLRLLGGWLEQAVAHWPRRRSLRRENHPHGKRIDLRETLRASRRTGFETLRLARTRPRRRDRPVVLICDVSRSMQPYTTVYLHLMRAAALHRNSRRRSGIRPEVFAFSTRLTRLTAVLAHRSPEVARDRADAKVVDRYGGTHLGRSLAELLASPHGNALRGAVVIIASDGWDSDPPELLGHTMARLRRRAQRVVWLNPRAGRPGFAPLTGAMAAALPYCDAMLPAHSLTALHEVFVTLANQ
ncbi:vWA domain-containing protein [Mycolicibacterium thermoresistibile]|uniref:VWFA domain-containing protein n=2 Tax=Mycolicibacterium thermoresistibile TaxID=1797 RepID=G7CHW5_MYCT3|nr:VWA domain-containing protein [Mycolicibacterium thermoresistibile]EHI12425.1 hypothetical protein KEK_16038 [Mycolicibacterium thermoresistibile ATCC 19527]MCV7190867.1 VWA domain-containing protein [Mycolicibacterium thermoresistibile]GAT15795.1 VWA containing CoxE-like protein [Mycolicibacterium thermoresistibile]SNW16660.1 VWA containing CoxE-like protein [Mycolicibacterium thermoresistibile]